MQFTKIASVLAMAAAATAAPAPGNYEVEPRTGGGNKNQPACSAQSQQVCCTGLSCLVQVLGGCSTSSFCCETDAPDGALVNVALLNCVNLL